MSLNCPVCLLVGLCRPVKYRRLDRDQIFADGGIFYNYPVHCYDGKLIRTAHYYILLVVTCICRNCLYSSLCHTK